jgi:hypothetical protein
MHAEIDQHKPETELRSKDAPIYLPPAGDSLEAWRDLPYRRDSWVGLLTYWVNELHWRKSFWGNQRR